MLDKRYDFAELETRHAAAWERDNAFAPVIDGRTAFTIMMPPPNVTGTLHLGHALDNTLPDILIRRARMQGKAALYQPGTDHASIAVHVVLERQWTKQGKSRFDYGRDAFMEKAWEWKDHSAGQITNQLRRLGVSCDWGNERFTMDPAYTVAVNRAFVLLHEKSLIYRGQRLVNWDPRMQTAVSDLEVKHKEVQGHLWHVLYKFADGSSYAGKDGIEIATTRPETILGDGAVAIHPTDPRAKELVGKKVLVPVVNREISIVADEMVDPDFGSGMVKITAAHDFNDFAFYQRHKDTVDVPLINLLTPDGHLNENCPPAYVGLGRMEARNKLVAELEQLGQLLKVEPHTHNVGHAERDDTVLEPYLTWQWYIRAEPLAKKCLAAADSGAITFINERDAKVYRHWLENIQDWCISRQLWWGHRIPAWYKGDEIYVGEKAPAGEGWRQEEDILDTWFSSGLWPFATQGWPHGGERLMTFYPGTVVMSGRDILFFWLVRMMMMGLELTDEVPFKAIYTHGLILDEHGQKMSKSKGNVTDPLDLIKEYGADALRFTMASICSSEDMRFTTGKIEQSRNFGTKLWNAARFVLMKDIRHTAAHENTFDSGKLVHPVNRWIVAQVKKAFNDIDGMLDRYEFAQAANAAYHFAWGTWCDWYLELTKPLLLGEDAAVRDETQLTMGWAFDKLLRLLQPFMPFVTEEIWQQLTLAESGHYLMHQRWPHYAGWKIDGSGEEVINHGVELIGQLRQARTVYRVPVKSKIGLAICNPTPAQQQQLATLKPFLQSMAGVADIDVISRKADVGEAGLLVDGIDYVAVLQAGIDLVAERARLQNEQIKYQAEMDKINGLLGNEAFVAKAPAAVVATNQVRLAELQQQWQAAAELLNGPYRSSEQ